MDFKFESIGASHLKKEVLREIFEANVDGIKEMRTKKDNKKYGKFVLRQGKSKIDAYAFGETYETLKKKLKKGVLLKFPHGTFSLRKRDKKFPSNSTCKYDLTFCPKSSFMTTYSVTSSTTKDTTDNGSSRQSAVQRAPPMKRVKKISEKYLSAKFSGGEVYRYWGCKTCSYSIPRKHIDDKYYCKGICNNKNISGRLRKKRIGVVTERKLCIVVRGVGILDKTNEVIGPIIIFNSLGETLFEKSGSTFQSDNDAMEAWNNLIRDHLYDITIRRKKKKRGSPYPPSLYLNTVDKVLTKPTMTIESTSSYSTDNDSNKFGEKKKGERMPNFPKYEMKLQERSSDLFTNKISDYEITSKPLGTVLLINNLNYPHYDAEADRIRKGSEEDIRKIESGFKELGFEIYGGKCQMDIQTVEDFIQLRDNFKKKLIEQKVDSCFIIMSSHGTNYEVALTGIKEESINIVEDVMIAFSDENFPDFQGKPKIFMPLTCQNFGTLSKGGKQPSLDFLGNKLYDMLVCFPCIPGYEARRYHSKGTLYVQYMMKSLMDHAKSWHLTRILEQVQHNMKNQIELKHLKITVPHWLSSVFKRFYFVPIGTVHTAVESDKMDCNTNAMEIDDVD